MKKALLFFVPSIFAFISIGQAVDRPSATGEHAAVERVTFHGEWFPLYGKGGTPIVKGNLAGAKVKPEDDVAIPEEASVVLDGRVTCRNLYVASDGIATNNVIARPWFCRGAIS